MSQIFGMEYIQKLEAYVAKYPAVDNYLNSLEEKTKVKKIYLIYGIVATAVFWLMFGYGAQLLCNGIGFLYPAYCSVKALESSKKDDDTQWLVYWVVFAMFSVLEFFSDILVGWIPFYWFFKCIFLVWLMSPLDGSSVIYNRIILPLFHKNQSKIDSYLDRGKNMADKAFNEAAKIAAEVESKKSE